MKDDERSTEMETEQIDTRTEEGAQRSAELAEKVRKKRRSESQLISDGIMDIHRRFNEFALECASGSIEAAIDRGEVIRADEVERRIIKAKAAARAELIEYLKQQGDDGK